MGFGGIGPWQLLIILAIVLLIFGTKKIRNLGGDLGGAIKGFKNAMQDDGKKEDTVDENKTDQEIADQSEAEAETKAETNAQTATNKESTSDSDNPSKH